MARKVNSLKWVVILVMSILSVGFAVSCSDDDKCSDDSCITKDSGPQPDKDVKGDGIQTDEGTPDQTPIPSNCPAKGVAFDCYSTAGGGGKPQAQTWISEGMEGKMSGKIVCSLIRSSDGAGSWFHYDKTTKIAKEPNMYLLCNLAK